MQPRKKPNPNFKNVIALLHQPPTNENGWSLEYEGEIEESNQEHNMKAYSKLFPNDTLAMTRIEMTWKGLDLDKLYRLGEDLEIQKNSESIETIEQVEKFNENEDIIYCQIKTAPSLPLRDSYLYRCIIDNKKDPELIKAYGLETKTNRYFFVYKESVLDYPETLGIIRTIIKPSTSLIEQDPNDPKKVHMTTLIHTDLAGGIPHEDQNKKAKFGAIGFAQQLWSSYVTNFGYPCFS